MKIILVTLFIVIAEMMAFAQTQGRSPFDTTSYGSNQTTGHYLAIRGIKMYYEIYGKGEPILLIHGNNGSISSFMHQIPYFSRHYKIIAVDSRSQGRSADQGDSLSFEMMADDFNVLLDSLHTDSCLVIGWSDGAINGLLLSIRHPDKVKKLAVTGANLWPDSNAFSSSDIEWGINYYDSLKKMPSTPALRNQLKLTRLDLFQPHITLDQLHQIRCPSLIISGDRDVILPEHTLLIAHNIQHSYLWIVPGSGHATLIEHRDDFNRKVDQFFRNRIEKN